MSRSRSPSPVNVRATSKSTTFRPVTALAYAKKQEEEKRMVNMRKKRMALFQEVKRKQ